MGSQMDKEDDSSIDVEEEDDNGINDLGFRLGKYKGIGRQRKQRVKCSWTIVDDDGGLRERIRRWGVLKREWGFFCLVHFSYIYF